MKTNFEASIATAIETVAAMLNETVEAITKAAMTEGPIRDSVMRLAIHAGKK